MTAPFPSHKQEEWRYADLDALRPVWEQFSEPVTLTVGADWAGVVTPAAHHPAKGKAKSKAAGGQASAASQGNQATVQTRNAGASICSGLPQANPNPGVPGP